MTYIRIILFASLISTAILLSQSGCRKMGMTKPPIPVLEPWNGGKPEMKAPLVISPLGPYEPGSHMNLNISAQLPSDCISLKSRIYGLDGITTNDPPSQIEQSAADCVNFNRTVGFNMPSKTRGALVVELEYQKNTGQSTETHQLIEIASTDAPDIASTVEKYRKTDRHDVDDDGTEYHYVPGITVADDSKSPDQRRKSEH